MNMQKVDHYGMRKTSVQTILQQRHPKRSELSVSLSILLKLYGNEQNYIQQYNCKKGGQKCS